MPPIRMMIALIMNIVTGRAIAILGILIAVLQLARLKPGTTTDGPAEAGHYDVLHYCLAPAGCWP